MKVKKYLYISLCVCTFLVLFMVLKSLTYHPWKTSFKTVEERWAYSTVNTSSQPVIVGNKISVVSTAVTASISPISLLRSSSFKLTNSLSPSQQKFTAQRC